MVLIMNVELNFKLILWSFMLFLYSRFCYTSRIRFCCSSARLKWITLLKWFLFSEIWLLKMFIWMCFSSWEISLNYVFIMVVFHKTFVTWSWKTIEVIIVGSSSDVCNLIWVNNRKQMNHLDWNLDPLICDIQWDKCCISHYSNANVDISFLKLLCYRTLSCD